MKKSAALFILKMREVKCLPQKTIDNLIDDTTELVSTAVATERITIKNIMSKTGIDVSSNQDLLDHLECTETSIFKGLETEYMQTKYFKEKFHLLVRACTW